MNAPAPINPPPLLDLLGARWAMDAAVAGIAWDAGAAGFALADGSVAVARSAWDGQASLGTREDGGIDVTPATAAPPPVSRQRTHEGACLAIAAAPGGGFLSGGEDGRLVHTSPDGTATELARFPGQPAHLVASGPAGFHATTAGRSVQVGGPDGFATRIDLPAAATALGFDRDGARLAVGFARGAALWSAGTRETAWLEMALLPRALAWSPDGTHLAFGHQEGAVQVWRDGSDTLLDGHPGQPRSLAFSADGTFLAASGGPRVLCYGIPPQPGQPPVECGRSAARWPVCRVACHPVHPVLAAGYRNGAVLLCLPGAEEALFLREASLPAGDDTQAAHITALAWSGDGEHLAIGTAGGEASVVRLPALLFRLASHQRGTP